MVKAPAERGSVQSDGRGEEEFTCEICVEVTSNKLFNNGGKCSHPFCTDCVMKYLAAKLQDNVGDIKCPAIGCDHSIDCTPFVGAALFVRWCDVLCESAITETGNDTCYCPYPNCNELIVNECGDRVTKTRCANCKRFLCFKCQRIWHAGFRCNEIQEIRDSNDAAFGRLAERNRWMRCPRCKHFVELRYGCSIVKCRCRASFCYKCGRQLQRHYCGCDVNIEACHLCRLFCLYAVIFIGYLVFLSC